MSHVETPTLYNVILDLLSKTENLAIAELAEKTGTTKKSIRSYLYFMKQAGHVQPHPRFRGVYSITDLGRKHVALSR